MSEGETVLEALERSDVDVPSGCRSGTCCKCMLQAQGDPPPASQKGLRPTLSSQGFFLACQARPSSELVLRSSAGPEALDTRVVAIERVAPDVAQVFLRAETPFEFRPGQYLDVLHPGGLARSYSIASLPSDGVYELHVRQIPEGRVSGWLHERSVGDTVRIRGPFGQCFHVADDPEKKLLLVGAGTGLSPLLGIARDAIAQGHRGPIDLVHGALEPSRLYLREELAALATRTPTLNVHHCVLHDATPNEREGALGDVAVDVGGELSGTRAFLCGDDAVVRSLQRQLFLAGVPSREILADPFAPAPDSEVAGTG